MHVARMGFRGRFSVFFLAAFISVSVSGAERLRRAVLSNEYALPADGKVKIAFFDADWTLRTTKSGATTPIDSKDVVLLPFVAEKVREFSAQGYLVAIISNQPWVPKRIPAKVAEKALAYTAELLAGAGAVVHYIDYGDEASGKLKPGNGMARGLVEDLTRRFGAGSFSVDWEKSFMVGDAAYEGPTPAHRDPILWPKPDHRTYYSRSDKGFAENVGIRFFEAKYFFGWKQFGIDTFMSADEVHVFLRSPHCAMNLLAAAPHL